MKQSKGSFRWCVCDLDGTLLNNKNQISEENIRVLQQIQKQGVDVLLATGRSDLTVRPFIKQLKLTTPVISCNGGLIRNAITDEILHVQALPIKVAKQVMKWIEERSFEYLIYSTTSIYTNQENSLTKRFRERDEKIPICIDPQLSEHLDQLNVLKILVVGSNWEELQAFANSFPIEWKNKLTSVRSGRQLLDIMSKGVSKGNALTILADQFNIDLKEVIAFGDNENDLSMFQVAGFSVAPANAAPEIQEHVDYVTRSNLESGVAYALKKWVVRD
ncbi:hypothetical protein SAMN05444392_101406 [Seinonella peptonophila]|uniref:Cof subfamily of IIB subfamily of haloacid dehalogenase superfamily/HAD-superfamily hydrolase, subfamily IIB n=1 Tax=Seinonella peptonophila TaxID=112248 RepID=A0A1M4TCF1_9BACL|nr:Cof-type HAD-IIB family hydrolase [Seinonella peptonophila]SHE42055.1 hypothetical protein SAMN05444392_101406 [Seinonella peptonophila]